MPALVPSYLKWIIAECGAECVTGEYLGCYKDEESSPALTQKITLKGERFNIDKCRKECNGRNDYESAKKYGISHTCGPLKLGGVLSNSLYVHSGFEQKIYLPDQVLQNGINL
eukprot:547617_1